MDTKTPASTPGLPAGEHKRSLEKQALDRVLSSGVFDRSRSLSKLLNYICGKYFDDQTDEIKEYNIAVEALGRPADFDQKKDAIVRVEMHRLRKRLREYYASAGARDPVQSGIAEKGYVPEFIFRSEDSALLEVTEKSETPEPDHNLPETGPPTAPGPETIEPKGTSSKYWILLALVIVAIGITLLTVRTSGTPSPAVQSQLAEAPAQTAPSVATEGPEVRILAGRGPGKYTDRDGQIWEGDRYFRGGEAVPARSDIISRGFDRNLFGGMREGRFQYDIPLKPGVYEMELLFAETFYGESNALGGGESSRPFDIQANGASLVDGLDVLADAGAPNLADSRIFKDLRPAADGLLHLSFNPQPGRKAFVNAIRIHPSQPGRMNPIRIVARPQAYRDPRGIWWQSDRYYLGGTSITRPTVPWVSDEAYVYQGERFGNFSYSIPVPPGRYAATLYFWEYWWGKDHPGKGGAGSRKFSIYCNFKPLLTNFDIIAGGGGGDLQTAKKTFNGLTPNQQGKLVFAFVPEVNYPLINAIEIVDELK